MLEILFPLSLTLAIETPIYLILKWRDFKLFVVASVLNLILNPIMNIILLLYIDNQSAYYLFLTLYEIGTTLVESLVIFLFMRFKYWKVLLIAIGANGTSLLVGILMQPVYNTIVTILVLTIFFFSVFIFLEVLTLLSFVRNNRQSHDSDNDTSRDNA